MAHVPGAHGSGFPLAGRRVVDMANQIYYVAPDVAKFTTLLGMMGKKESCHDIQFKWPEDEYWLQRGCSGVLNGSSSAERFTFVSWEAVGTGELIIQFNQAEDFRAFEAAPLTTDTDVRVRIRWQKTSDSSWTYQDYYIRPDSVGDFPINRSTQRITFTSYGAGTDITAEADVKADSTLSFIVQDPSTLYNGTDKAFGGLQQMTGAVKETRKKTVIKDAFVQEFKVTFPIAAELMNTRMYGGPELKRGHLRKARQYRTNVELALLLNGRGSSSYLGGTDPFGYDAPTSRLTGLGAGVTATGGGTDERGFIRSKNYNSADGGTDTTWQIDVSGGYTTFYTQLLDILEKVTQSGSEDRYAFVSREWLIAFDKGIRGEGFARWEMKDSKYGFKVGNISTTPCDLKIVPVRFFQGVSMDGQDLSKYMVLLDMASVKLRPMAGMDTALYTNTQDNDVWGRQDEWRGCMGLQMIHEEQNAICNLKTS
jgi:hypothetical protein